MMSKKRIHYSCEDGIEKSPLKMIVCHHSASLVIPIGDPQDGFFYLTLTFMIDSYIPLQRTANREGGWWSIASRVFGQSPVKTVSGMFSFNTGIVCLFVLEAIDQFDDYLTVKI